MTTDASDVFAISLAAGDQESELEGLLFIQARIAERLVSLAKVLVLESLASASTFRDCVAGKFQVDAAKERAAFLVDAQSGRQLREDGCERSRLHA